MVLLYIVAMMMMSGSHDHSIYMYITQVSGSHDHSLRVWERTQEPLVLSDQREMVGINCHGYCIHGYCVCVCLQEREKLMDQLSVADPRERVVGQARPQPVYR